MVFNAIDRGILEQLFDNSISNMKPCVDLARDEMFQNTLHDKDGNDLALGVAIGIIHASFINGFRMRNGCSLNSVETNELMRITKEHLGKLKEAVFKCG